MPAPAAAPPASDQPLAAPDVASADLQQDFPFLAEVKITAPKPAPNPDRNIIVFPGASLYGVGGVIAMMNLLPSEEAKKGYKEMLQLWNEEVEPEVKKMAKSPRSLLTTFANMAHEFSKNIHYCMASRTPMNDFIALLKKDDNLNRVSTGAGINCGKLLNALERIAVMAAGVEDGGACLNSPPDADKAVGVAVNGVVFRTFELFAQLELYCTGRPEFAPFREILKDVVDRLCAVPEKNGELPAAPSSERRIESKLFNRRHQARIIAALSVAADDLRDYFSKQTKTIPVEAFDRLLQITRESLSDQQYSSKAGVPQLSQRKKVALGDEAVIKKLSGTKLMNNDVAGLGKILERYAYNIGWINLSTYERLLAFDAQELPAGAT